MKKIYLLLILLSINVFAYSSNIQGAYAIAVFDKNGNGENVQHKMKTDKDYNGTCFSKIVVFGFLNNKTPQVKIGNSIGQFIKSTPVYGQRNLKIGEELTYKHFGIEKGYFEIRIDNKLYDTKVFVK